jgi:hypothetical protein
MTIPSQYPIPPVAPIVRADDDEPDESGPTVGASDADADAARSGADVDLGGATRDSDGVPVGRADAEEDARRTGADPDES